MRGIQIFFTYLIFLEGKKLRIDSLKNDQGVWIDDPLLVEDHIQNYFISLFNNEPVDVLDHWCKIATHKLSHDENK